MYQDNALKLLGDAQNPTHNVPAWPRLNIIFPIIALFCHFCYFLGQSRCAKSLILSIYVYQGNALEVSGDAQNPIHNVPVRTLFCWHNEMYFDALKATVLDPVHSFLTYMCIRIMPWNYQVVLKIQPIMYPYGHFDYIIFPFFALFATFDTF